MQFFFKRNGKRFLPDPLRPVIQMALPCWPNIFSFASLLNILSVGKMDCGMSENVWFNKNKKAFPESGKAFEYYVLYIVQSFLLSIATHHTAISYRQYGT
jgi:hypothetical protein